MKPVYVDDINGVKAFEYGDINPSAYREEILLKEDGQRVTGIDDRAQSVSPRGSTATESAILKEATLKRLRMKIWVMSRTLLQEQIRLRVPNILQFYKTPKVNEIMGKDSIEKMLKIRELAEEGRLMRQGGKFFEMEYRTIVTKNKKLERANNGEVNVKDERGDNYFMVTPDLLPVSATVFNYKLTAEPTFPLSKPLQQQKINELFNNPVIKVAVESGYYDYKKAADEIMELNDFNPEDFLSEPIEEKTQQHLLDPAKMIEYANEENELMLGGEEMVGTPFSTPEHTAIHLEFMKSDKFKSAPTNIIKNFASHVYDEALAQEYRGKAIKKKGQMAGAQAPTDVAAATANIIDQGQGMGRRSKETMGIEAGAAKATNPAMMQGAESLPDFTGGME
jgi:hypothetical protein